MILNTTTYSQIEDALSAHHHLPVLAILDRCIGAVLFKIISYYSGNCCQAFYKMGSVLSPIHKGQVE